MRRGYILAFGVSLLVVVGLLCATLYANEGYPWPTEEEFKAEMVLVEEEYPGLLHTLLMANDDNSAQRWGKIEAVFDIVDWDTWPWQSGAFYRQFNAPGWIGFFDSYELVPAVAMFVFVFIAYKFWQKADEAKRQLKLLGAQAV